MRISSKPQDCKRKFYKTLGRAVNYELKKIGTYAVNIQIIVAGQAINHKYATNHILNHLDEELSERLIKDVYERIHPFEDGNGRTGRLILNFELIRNNMPPIVIPKDDRIKYFGMLAEQNSQELAGFFKELCQEEQQRIEALAGCGKRV